MRTRKNVKYNKNQKNYICYICKIISFLLNIPLLSAILIINSIPLYSQTEPEDFKIYYDSGDLKKAAEIITKNLIAIYDKRSDKKSPSDFITVKEAEKGRNLKLYNVFKNRKAEGFFIESNNELFNLHIYAARCFFNMKEYDTALNHYYQALRFKNIEFEKDDAVYYEMAQVYNMQKQNEAYRRMLEAAYSLNQTKYEYSLELGKSLSRTNEKKKAIYHLERYVQSKGEADDPSIYLLIGNLNEDIGRYIETVKNYENYLKKKPEDGYIHYALGYLAYKRTGNYTLAQESFDKALKYLPEKDMLHRSKANEYKGDMFMKELEFDRATDVYQKTVKYQEEILADIREKMKDILKIKDEIRNIKSQVSKDNELGSNYYNSLEKKGKAESENKEKNYEYSKLNAGKIRWNLAEIHERTGKLDAAIKYYREAISLDYNPNLARQRIIKLELKINRGY